MNENTTPREYRDTLNLPKTSFPMKADLPKREPDRVQWWQEHRTYERRLESNKQREPWILHDGPPYANGDLHMGHFLNMTLKDIFVKIALLDGRWAKFVPGWDMHGLPIELDTLKHLKIKDFHAIDPIELRSQCRERAIHWLNIQRATRMRMGNFADFEHPYRTIDPEFEATILEALAELAEKNQLYKGLRSTLWCIHDETALAEAEIEYADKVSPSVYVRFTADDTQRAEILDRFKPSNVAPRNEDSPPPVILSKDLAETNPLSKGAVEWPQKISVLIWTTTPWTLPANVAIALKPDAVYGLYEHKHEAIIVAEALASKVLGQHFGEMRKLGTATGAQLEGLEVAHPFLARSSRIVLADYVELETGTGAVHTAPGHGSDDFETGMKYNLPILNPVDARGIFTAEAGPYAGRHIFKANSQIVEDLRENGALYDALDYTHSYPHCWRCHNPVIFRATSQWFIAMDQNKLRARTIDAIKSVDWTPQWGENRIAQMLENHPEWCISRQRTWGTPIPALACGNCGESVLSPEVARIAAARFRESGANVWWSDPIESFLPPRFACAKCAGTTFEKEYNIVDIWFESGVTHLAVLGKDGLPWPADLVLEGGDQYRGWFRSSIVTAVAIKGAAPYRHVVKNGWVNDPTGRPMSKSLGNFFSANDAMAQFGADVLRLWCASVEFIDDVRFGKPLVENVSQVYRNIRNRARFMLSNLDDFTPQDTVARADMLPLDSVACEVTDAWAARVQAQYHAFELHDAYLSIIAFDGEDMSSFYLDALKDRLYSSAPNSHRRRSAQSAIWYIFQQFMRVLAPLLSFTAEEAWQSLPQALRADTQSVFDLEPLEPPAENERAPKLWNLLRQLRATVAASTAPRDFEAQAIARASGEAYDLLKEFGEEHAREALVVSAFRLIDSEGSSAPATIELQPADGQKCQRCWKYLPLGADSTHPTICAACAATVEDLAAV
ncbi:MAG: isoleucine--tRNA ligase [Candidatus Eremiobacteraeota bacterium]|nr:isoleucine--tRNA ligase [Candidatus Eremiobacteraeota bacterium]